MLKFSTHIPKNQPVHPLGAFVSLWIPLSHYSELSQQPLLGTWIVPSHFTCEWETGAQRLCTYDVTQRAYCKVEFRLRSQRQLQPSSHPLCLSRHLCQCVSPALLTYQGC